MSDLVVWKFPILPQDDSKQSMILLKMCFFQNLSQFQSTTWIPIVPIKIKACGRLWHRRSKPLRMHHCQSRSLWSTSFGMRLPSETERWGTVPPRSHKWNDCPSSFRKSRRSPITTGRTIQEPTEEIQFTQWKPLSGMNHGLSYSNSSRFYSSRITLQTKN